MSHLLTARLIVPLLALSVPLLASPGAVVAQQRSARVPQEQEKAKVNASAAALHKAEAEHKAEAAAFRSQEDARIQKENAKLQARLTLIKQGKKPDAASRDQIGAEARQLKDRATKARTDAERAQIHKRAQELLEQLGRE